MDIPWADLKVQGFLRLHQDLRSGNALSGNPVDFFFPAVLGSRWAE
jgi:hypothetical protein